MSATDDPLAGSKGQPTVVGGYRVIRTLGVGARATVWIGHSDKRADVQAVALKVFTTAGAASIAAETSAYELVDSPHVARLLDVCAGPDTDVCLVLEWLGGGSLATLVRQRRRIRAGEAVTVLVSVLRGIHDLHAAGLAHNALRPTNVLFDQCGRPVLVSLGHTSRLPPRYSVAAVDARRGDWMQFLAIVDLVMDRVEADGREAEESGIRRALEDIAHTDDERSSCDRLEELLYAFAQPAPIILHPTSIPGSAHRSQTPEAEMGPAPRRAARRAVSAELVARTEAILDAGPIQSLKAAISPALRRRRKQLVFGAVLAAAVGVLGLAAIPQDSGGAPSTTRPSARPPGSVTPHPASTPSPTVAVDPPTADDPITQDEPVRAVVALLQARARCGAERSIACLKRVDQDASPLLSADTATLTEHDPLAEFSGVDASLIERTGDSALVELGSDVPSTDGATAPPSVLAIKSETGWRLREIFAG